MNFHHTNEKKSRLSIRTSVSPFPLLTNSHLTRTSQTSAAPSPSSSSSSSSSLTFIFFSPGSETSLPSACSSSSFDSSRLRLFALPLVAAALPFPLALAVGFLTGEARDFLAVVGSLEGVPVGVAGSASLPEVVVVGVDLIFWMRWVIALAVQSVGG